MHLSYSEKQRFYSVTVVHGYDIHILYYCTRMHLEPAYVHPSMLLVPTGAREEEQSRHPRGGWLVDVVHLVATKTPMSPAAEDYQHDEQEMRAFPPLIGSNPAALSVFTCFRL